jgi:hypothetical protein
MEIPLQGFESVYEADEQRLKMGELGSFFHKAPLDSPTDGQSVTVTARPCQKDVKGMSLCGEMSETQTRQLTPLAAPIPVLMRTLPPPQVGAT